MAKNNGVLFSTPTNKKKYNFIVQNKFTFGKIIISYFEIVQTTAKRLIFIHIDILFHCTKQTCTKEIK